MPKMRATQKYRRSILWACENFSDLKKVRKTYRCSSALIYRVLFEQLERKLRQYRYPWPSKFARGFRKHYPFASCYLLVVKNWTTPESTRFQNG